jgi:hypothetical protein
MLKTLPLWVNLLYGGLYIFVFTGMWMVMNDMEKLMTRTIGHPKRQLLEAMLLKVKTRRILSLLGGIALIILYFFERNMNVFVAVLFGVLWLDSLMLGSKARQLVSTFYSVL